MVRDWWESFERGEDAVMIAKRNVEVERLNAMAREVMREDRGRLGAEEIEVGEPRFAAGDQVITRVNDRATRSTTASAGGWPRSTPSSAGSSSKGSTRAQRVEVGADYLARTNPHSDAPALQHAYAVTTYSAQGTTVDRAFVARRPLDGQAGALRRRLPRAARRPTYTRLRRSRVDREEIRAGVSLPARGHPPYR